MCLTLMAACIALGFGLGRIKNLKKLAIVQAELDKAKAYITGLLPKA